MQMLGHFVPLSYAKLIDFLPQEHLLAKLLLWTHRTKGRALYY